MGVYFTPVKIEKVVKEIGESFNISYSTMAEIFAGLELLGYKDLADELDKIMVDGEGMLDPEMVSRLVKALKRLLRVRGTLEARYEVLGRPMVIKVTERTKKRIKDFIDFLEEYEGEHIQVS